MENNFNIIDLVVQKCIELFEQEENTVVLCNDKVLWVS